jgi:hypothetical protein
VHEEGATPDTNFAAFTCSEEKTEHTTESTLPLGLLTVVCKPIQFSRCTLDFSLPHFPQLFTNVCPLISSLCSAPGASSVAAARSHVTAHVAKGHLCVASLGKAR